MPLLPSHALLQAYSLVLFGTAYLLLTSPLTLANSGPLWLLGEAMRIRPAMFSSSLHEHDPSTTSGPGGIQLTRRNSFLTKLTGNSTTDLPPATRELLALLAFVLLLAAITQAILATPLRYSASDLTALAQRSANTSRPKAQRDDDTSAFAESLHTLHTSQTLFLTLSGLRVLLEGTLIATIYLVYADKANRLSASFPLAAAEINASEAGSFPGSSGYGFLGVGLLANRITFTLAMTDMLFWGYIWTVLREEASDLASILKKRRTLLEEQEQSEY